MNNKTRYIDLSYTLDSNISVHPYDDNLSLKRHKHLDKDKYNDSLLVTGMHVGTHIDAPSHLLNSNTLISDYPLDKFISRGCLIDVRGESIISMKEKYKSKIKEDDIVLLYTDHSNHFKDENYFKNHPVIDEEFANYLVSKNIKMIGMDLPSPDEYPFNIHKNLLENDILIIENLMNLESLIGIDDFEVVAVPLNIKAEGSLARVYAKY